MIELSNELISKRSISESTAGLYLRSLYTLNDKKPFRSLVWLKDTETIESRLSGYAVNTQKTMYSALVSVLSLVKDKQLYKNVYNYYHNRMTLKRDEVKEVAKSNTKTKKESTNWISWQEVSKIRDGLKEKVKSFKDDKKITKTQYDTLLKTLILSIYTDIQPRRNQDYIEMNIENGEPTTNTCNLLLLDKKGNPYSFVFNKYKTAKTYGKQEIMIPSNLSEILTIYLNHHPSYKKKDSESTPLLVNYKGEPLKATNSITRILNHIFKKKVGSSMLRHIYLSNKYDINEMKEDAIAMGHSLEEQKAYMRTNTTDSKDNEST
jgi:hypothetical protein